MTTTFEKVREFHAKFGLMTADRVGPHAPRIRPDAVKLLAALDHLRAARDILRAGTSVPAYRLGFLVEEVSELAEGYLKHDPEKIADSLADIDYVCAGTSHMHGIPHDAVVAVVHAANMRKAHGPTERRADDIYKPPGWQPPDVAGVLLARALEIG